MGYALDSAALKGTGASAEPGGIRNHADVNTVTGVGTPADYSDLTTAVKEILEANYDGEISGLSWVSHPRDGATYDGLVDTTNQPLNPTPWARDLMKFSTTSVDITEGGGNESFGIVGDFSQVIIGMRTTGVNIRVLDSGTVTDSSGTTWNAASQLLRLVVAYMRADVAILRPTWLNVLSGITA